MTEKNICPGCERHCDLSEPRCGRGEEYSRTGNMQKQYGRPHDHKVRTARYHNADMNDKLIINLRDLSHMMRLLYEGKASQRRILIILNESEAMTQRELTERLEIKPGSASEILSKLENAGLIVRTQNKADRRTTDICLTDSGRDLAVKALVQRQKRHEEMFSCLSEEESRQLLSLLERICADWRERYDGNRDGHERGHHQDHQNHYGSHGHGRRDGHRYHGGPHGRERD